MTSGRLAPTAPRAPMTLATGKNKRQPANAAFTLIEIVLVIALMAVAAGIVIANFVAFADRGEETSPVETLHSAIRSARFHAASSRQLTTLQFDKENGQLVLSSGDSFPLNEDFGQDGPGEINFYLVPPAEGLAPFPDPESSDLETSAVSFAPDRSSSPFVVEIDTGSGNAERLVFDPFSSLVRSSE